MELKVFEMLQLEKHYEEHKHFLSRVYQPGEIQDRDDRQREKSLEELRRQEKVKIELSQLRKVPEVNKNVPYSKHLKAADDIFAEKNNQNQQQQSQSIPKIQLQPKGNMKKRSPIFTNNVMVDQPDQDQEVEDNEFSQVNRKLREHQQQLSQYKFQQQLEIQQQKEGDGDEKDQSQFKTNSSLQLENTSPENLGFNLDENEAEQYKYEQKDNSEQNDKPEQKNNFEENEQIQEQDNEDQIIEEKDQDVKDQNVEDEEDSMFQQIDSDF